MHFWGQIWAIFGIFALQNNERALEVKLHIPSPSLDASRKWFSTGLL